MDLYPAKAVEWIKILFGLETPGGLRNIVLDGGPDFPTNLMWPKAFAKVLWPPLVNANRTVYCTLKVIAPPVLCQAFV